ncbi:MAG: F0F1 ATP synthase subunit gamma [bacterium]|nr:F0F1 ATP synthase subunit gamma [bacterium]
MSKVKEIKREVEFFNDLKYLTEAYEEIAVMRMKKIRSLILASRRFMERAADVFFDVKLSYKRQVEKLLKSESQNPGKSEKRLAILISPDSKLYGDLTGKVLALFMKNAAKYNEVVVIGKVGAEFVRANKLDRQTRSLFVERFKLTKEDLHRLAQKFVEFEKIDVYHPRFENLVMQVANTTNISGDRPKLLMEEKKSGQRLNFLVEPSIDKVFNFFKTQALISLFKGTLGESELALLASRIKAMERAIERIDKNIDESSKRVLREQRFERDRRQLEQLAGVSLWQVNGGYY